MVGLRNEAQPVHFEGVVHLLDDVRVVGRQVQPLAGVPVEVEQAGVGPAIREEIVHLPDAPAIHCRLLSQVLHRQLKNIIFSSFINYITAY